jgi:membrane protease YdiL (CAAX protease family)
MPQLRPLEFPDARKPGARGDRGSNRLLLFCSLTYLASWSLFLGSAVLSRAAAAGREGLAVLSEPVLLLGVFVPSLAALALTARDQGRVGALALLRRAAAFPARARWYVFAVSYMAVIKLSAAVLHRAVAGAWPAFGQESIFVMAGATLLSTPVQAGEEIGWRGYALPRLAARLGLGPASIVLGVVWACWHLPFFFLPGSDKTGQSLPVFVIAVTGLSVAMAWLYWRTGGSLLITMLMHAAVNNTKDTVPSPVAGATDPFTLSASMIAWLSTALLWVGAAFFLIGMRSARLVDAERTEDRGGA